MPAKAKPAKDSATDPSAPQITAVPAGPLPVPTTLGDARRIPRPLLVAYSDLIETSLAAPSNPDKAVMALAALDILSHTEGGPDFLTSNGIDPAALGEGLLALIPDEG